ncbi:MAG: helix-turn-helix domain-containing protein [Bryobacteraceae bacterium]
MQTKSKSLEAVTGNSQLPGERSRTKGDNSDHDDVLTIAEVARILRCSKNHVSNILNGKVPGVPTLTHFVLGRRKLVRRDWLNKWMEAYKTWC